MTFPKMFYTKILLLSTLGLAVAEAASVKSAAELDFGVQDKAEKTQTTSADTDLPDFYPFGSEVGDTMLPRDDDGFSPAIDIPSGLPTFSTVQNRAFVNTNGMISFTNGINEYKPKLFPLNGTEWLMLAIFWTDVDISPNTDSGTVYYRSVMAPGGKFFLDQMTSEIRIYFPNMVHFEAQFAIIATWVKVAPYRAHSYGIPDDARNTFQASLITDGRHSFIIYRYHAVEWSYQLSTKMTYAQAGVNSGDGRWAAVDGSGTSAFAVAAVRRSNVGRPGVWAFRIDNSPVLLAECSQLRFNRQPQSTGSLRVFPPWIHFSGDTTVSLSAPCLDLSTIQRADCQLADMRNGSALTPKIPAVFSISEGSTVTALSCQIPPIPSFDTTSPRGRDQTVFLHLTAVDTAEKEWSFVGTLNVLMTVQQPESKYHINGIDRFVWSGLSEVRLRWDASANAAQLLGAKPKLRFEALVFTGTVRDGHLISTEAEAFLLEDNLFSRSLKSGFVFGLKGEQTVRLDLLEARIWERIPQQSPALLMASAADIDNSVYFLDGETIVSGSSRVTSKVPLGVILRLIDQSGGTTFALTTSLGVYKSFAEHPAFACVDWINREMTRQAQQPLFEETIANKTALGCPPLERQAAADFRFQVDSVCSSTSDFCKDFRPFKCYEPVESQAFVCCYSSGRLCPNCGTTTFASPSSRLLEHIFTDVFPTMSCCPSSKISSLTTHTADLLSTAPLCQTTFKQTRPVPDNGTTYRAPRLAAFYGDPHLQTLDGFSYTYNGAGLFQLLETVPQEKSEAPPSPFEDEQEDVYLSIQGLFEPLGEGTVIQALSVYDGETVVDVFVREGNGVVVYVNGSYLSPFATTSNPETIGGKKHRIEVVQSMPGSIGPAFVSTRCTDNFRVFIETVNSTALSALVFLDERHLSQTRGLLGVWNRNMDDDLTLPNSTVLPLNSSASVIHHVFGQSWSLPSNMSHFRVRRRHGAFNNPKNKDFRPLFADSPEMQLAAKQNGAAAANCDADMQCLFDLLATGRPDVAKSTLAFRRRINELQHDLRLDTCVSTVKQLVVIKAPSGDIYTTPCPQGTTFAGLSTNEFCKISSDDEMSELKKRAVKEQVDQQTYSSPSMLIVQMPVCNDPSQNGVVTVGGVVLVNSMLHVVMYTILTALCLVLLMLLAFFTSRQRIANWWVRVCRRPKPSMVVVVDGSHRADSSISSGDDVHSDTSSSRASSSSHSHNSSSKKQHGCNNNKNSKNDVIECKQLLDSNNNNDSPSNNNHGDNALCAGESSVSNNNSNNNSNNSRECVDDGQPPTRTFVFLRGHKPASRVQIPLRDGSHTSYLHLRPSHQPPQPSPLPLGSANTMSSS